MRHLSIACLFLFVYFPRTAVADDTLKLGFEGGDVGKPPADWVVPTKNWTAQTVDAGAAEGKTCVKLFRTGESTEPFGNLLRVLDAKEYQGRHVRLTAKIRVEGDDGRSQMWLRADRPNKQMGAFDNMGDRPIMPGGWTDATIEADIEADAAQLVIGFMAFGEAAVFVDSVKLETGATAALQEPSPPRPLSARGRENLVALTRLLSYVRFFHPSDQAADVNAWDHFAVSAIEATEAASDPADLARKLQDTFAPLAPSLAVWAGGPAKAPPLPPAPAGATGLAQWRHNGAGTIGAKGAPSAYSSKVVHETFVGPPDDAAIGACYVVKELGGGVSCRLPLKVFADDKGTLPHAASQTDWSKTAGKPKLTALNRSTRLAGVTLCWGVMQHFYPYFDVVKTDWDAALPAALDKAAADSDELSYWNTLRELVAKLHDGHGNVWSNVAVAKDVLPLAFAWAGQELVVTGTHASVADGLSVGDVVLSIDGRSTAECHKDVSRCISAATEGWRRYIASHIFVSTMPTANPAVLKCRRPDGKEYEARVARVAPPPIESALDKRPDNGVELAPGIVYFNLDQAPLDALTKLLPQLEAAKGIVFDLRGYPAAAANRLISHLIDEAATSAQWNIPIVTRPDHEGWTEWSTNGRWSLPPMAPRLKAQIAFVTDGRAISYAESIMGIVEAYKLGEIVGATTAGTNGNVNPFTLPGGFSVSWTGMKVLKHDGSQHHGIGIKPTVPVEPTAKGIAEGRDEVLAKAVEVVQSKISAAASK